VQGLPRSACTVHCVLALPPRLQTPHHTLQRYKHPNSTTHRHAKHTPTPNQQNQLKSSAYLAGAGQGKDLPPGQGHPCGKQQQGVGRGGLQPGARPRRGDGVGEREAAAAAAAAAAHSHAHAAVVAAHASEGGAEWEQEEEI
jgi:hypothetical protein